MERLLSNIISFNRSEGRDLPDKVKSEIKEFKDSINAPKEENKITHLRKPVNLHPEKGRDLEGKEMVNRNYPRDHFSDDDLYDLHNLLDYMINASGRHNYNLISKILKDLLNNDQENTKITDRFNFHISKDEFGNFQDMLMSNARDEKHEYCSISRKILDFDDERFVKQDPEMIEMAKDDIWMQDVMSKKVWERFY